MATVLVTGATGYIGGLLVPRLQEAGHTVRVLTRRSGGLNRPDWPEQVQVATGDLSDGQALSAALAGVEVAYYLVHSMDGEGDFVERDRRLAQGFAAAAEAAGVSRIVYLGGLHPQGKLSAHLASRVEVGEIFLACAVPAAVLQAGVVLGDGSASFDMLRHLTERLPAMIAPKWATNRIQPIGIDDVLYYLVAAAQLASSINRSIDIGGPDVLTYAQMMQRYAKLTGLGPRPIVTVPVLTPSLASRWVGAVTPVPSGIARPLVGSLIHEAVCHDTDTKDLLGVPPGGLTGFDDAVGLAVRSLDPTRWNRIALTVGAAVALTAALGSVATDPSSSWYRSLDKPAWQPPAGLFPVVWTALYAGLGVASAGAVADLREADEDAAARAYAVALAANLALNTSWSAVFFRGHRLPAATVVAVALAASSADLARRAGSTGKVKATVLGGYATWCTFASALTAEIARRNP